MISLTRHSEGTILAVKAQPGARRNEIVGAHAGALRVAVSAAPERGKANEAILNVLSKAIGIKISTIALVAGPSSRNKKFLIRDLNEVELRKRLDVLFEAPSD